MHESKNVHRVRGIVLIVSSALALSGPAQAQSGLSDMFNRARSAVGDTVDRLGNKDTAASSPSTANTAALQSNASRGEPVVLKGNIRALFEKGTVTGSDLYETLKAIKLETEKKRSAKAWANFEAAQGAMGTQLQSGNVSSSLMDLFRRATEQFVEQLIRSEATDVSMKALDQHLQTLLDDRDGLAQESIKLPTSKEVTSEPQARRIVTLATLVVAARLSGRILEKAQANFKSLVVDYNELTAQREKAAGLLYAVILKRRAAQQGDVNAQASTDANLKGMTESDLAFIDKDLSRLTVAQFETDMAAQNLAIGYLGGQNDPIAKDYKIRADKYVERSNAYLRTISGVAAFGGILLTFAQTVGEIAKETSAANSRANAGSPQIGNALQALPFGADFIKAALPLTTLAVSTSVEGAVLQPVGGIVQSIPFLRPQKEAFTVTTDASTAKVQRASDVFDTLKGGDSEALLRNALFRSGAYGFLAQINRCDPAEAGRMIDATVPTDQRSNFARDYFGGATDFDGYSFLNGFESPGETPAERQLAGTLLGTDHRVNSPVQDMKRRQALAAIQAQVAQDYRKWGDDELTRLIFANREGAQIQYATLQLGPIAIRPVPSMQSLYVYESQANACKASIASDRDAGRRTTKPAPKEKTKVS